jgi:hypothetical protein
VRSRGSKPSSPAASGHGGTARASDRNNSLLETLRRIRGAVLRPGDANYRLVVPSSSAIAATMRRSGETCGVAGNGVQSSDAVGASAARAP